MASKVKYPIRLKLLASMSALVVLSTVIYLTLAMRLFRDDKQSLVLELNASGVKTVAAEVNSIFARYSDRVRLLTAGHRESAWVTALFQSDPDLVSYELYRLAPETNEWKVAAQHRNPEVFKAYGWESSGLAAVRASIPVPFAEASARGAVARNSTIQGGAPLLTLAVAVTIEEDRAPHVAVLDLKLDRLLRSVEREGIATRFLVDEEGRVLAHPDKELVEKRASLAGNPIVREAVDSSVALQQRTYELGEERWQGAFAKAGYAGIVAISQVSAAEAELAMRRLVQKSILFAGIVVTLSILLSGWLSRQFTRPLDDLLRATSKMAKWQFGSSIHVKTRDEIALLARAFNAMSSDIQRQYRELEGSREELELKVKERTSALEEQKRKAAEAQDALLRTTRLASLGELAGSAAHEILNPLNNINIRVEKLREQVTGQAADDLKLSQEILNGWGEAYASGGWEKLQHDLQKQAQDGRALIEEDLENLRGIASDSLARQGDQSESVEFISREVMRIVRIVNNMRSLSRVGGERRPLDIHQPLDDTAAALQDLTEKKAVQIVKEYSADPRDRFSVKADSDELVQVFSNLIRNAIHAVESAGRRAGTIKMATRREGARVEIRIEDNGAGIASANVGRIFEPDFTTKSLEQGTGLGLSISRRLVRAFGGDIELERSREGEGTVFLVWLPAHDAAAKSEGARG